MVKTDLPNSSHSVTEDNNCEFPGIQLDLPADYEDHKVQVHPSSVVHKGRGIS